MNTVITQNMLFKNLQQAVLISNDVLVKINEITLSINQVTKTVLSPLFFLVNTYKQLKCALLTLIALPLDLYTSAYDVVDSLIRSLKASGCGTTLMSGVSKVGYNTLQN